MLVEPLYSGHAIKQPPTQVTCNIMDYAWILLNSHLSLPQPQIRCHAWVTTTAAYHCSELAGVAQVAGGSSISDAVEWSGVEVLMNIISSSNTSTTITPHRICYLMAGLPASLSHGGRSSFTIFGRCVYRPPTHVSCVGFCLLVGPVLSLQLSTYICAYISRAWNMQDRVDHYLLSGMKPTMLESSVQAVVACNAIAPRVCTLVLFNDVIRKS